MTDTMTHIADAMAKVEAIRKELREAGAKTSRLDLATEVYNHLVDLQGVGGGIDPDETLETLERVTEKLAGGREALAMHDIEDALWDGLEAALEPLVRHVLFTQAYGE